MKSFYDFGIDIQGKTYGEVKTVCPKCSHTRRKKKYPCLNVNIDKGVWHCWHCEWSGGLKDGERYRPVIVKTWRKPDYVAQAEGIDPGVASWFAKRGIGESVLKRNQIAKGRRYFPQVEDERSCVLFPYLRGTEVVNIKARTHDKLFRMEAGCERVLYGLNDVDPNCLVWVEGEIDKLSVEEAGIRSCVSVPDGAPTPNTRNYSSKFDYLETVDLSEVKLHIIAVDADAPGVALKDELVRRLGREKCHVVRWPDGIKDANEALVSLGADGLAKLLEQAEPMPVDGAHDVVSFSAEIMEHYEHGRPQGVSTGWDAVDDLYTVLPGEWTLVTGIPGHGKSEWLDALALNLAQLHGWRFAVYSPENWPISDHVEKLAEKYTGKPFDPGPTERMTVADLDRATTFLNAHFTMLAPEDPTVDTLLTTLRLLVAQRGIKGAIIDPWNEIVHEQSAETETAYISEALGKIRRFARAHDVHFWIVAHPTKMPKALDTGKEPVPRPYDVAGSAHWNNKADNAITIWRNRVEDSAIVDVHVQKVRKKRLGRIGIAELRYDRVSGRYSDLPVDSNGRRYVTSGQSQASMPARDFSGAE